MNIEQANAAIGQQVTVSDGQPRPPERFNRKLEAWQLRNYSGRLEETRPNWKKEGYTGRIVTNETSYMVINVWVDIAKIEPRGADNGTTLLSYLGD